MTSNTRVPHWERKENRRLIKIIGKCNPAQIMRFKAVLRWSSQLLLFTPAVKTLCSGFRGKLWCQPPFQQLHLVMPPSHTVYILSLMLQLEGNQVALEGASRPPPVQHTQGNDCGKKSGVDGIGLRRRNWTSHSAQPIEGETQRKRFCVCVQLFTASR